jgi:thiamine biosynthesis lipoprotein
MPGPGLFDDHQTGIGPMNPQRKEAVSPADPAIREALSRVGAAGLKLGSKKIAFLKEGMGITLDGIAKGTIVDETIAFIRQAGIQHALVDAGGDLRVMGDGPGSPGVLRS